MRGDKKQSSMLVLMSPETRVPQSHPLRAIKKLADAALAKLSPVFDAMYAEDGRPSIPPEGLLESMLLMALYSVRSERQFCEQLDYNLLFRWFLDMDMVEESFVPTVFRHNRDRLIIHDAAGELLRAIVEEARKARLMSADHFNVDGTLIEAWASLKSFKKKDDDDKTPPDDPGNPTVDFTAEKRTNDTHESTTDPDAKPDRKGKGKEATFSYPAHVLTYAGEHYDRGLPRYVENELGAWMREGPTATYTPRTPSYSERTVASSRDKLVPVRTATTPFGVRGRSPQPRLACD